MEWLSSIRNFVSDRLSRTPRTEALDEGCGPESPPADPPPATIDGEAELRIAFRWLAWLKNRNQSLEALHAQIAAMVKQAYARELDLPAQGTTIPELLARPESLVIEYAQARPELFETSATHRQPY